MVIAAARIERRLAGGAAAVAGQVLMHAHLQAASAAKYGGLVPLRPWPHLGRVIGKRVMALAAGVVDSAAAQLDGDDIQWTVIVGAAGLGIERDATEAGRIGLPWLLASDSKGLPPRRRTLDSL